MSETFKQKVEEIFEGHCPKETDALYPCPMLDEEYTDCKQCQKNRILAAYKEAVEGMEQLDPFVQGNIVPLTAQFEACKKYLLEGLE